VIPWLYVDALTLTAERSEEAGKQNQKKPLAFHSIDKRLTEKA